MGASKKMWVATVFSLVLGFIVVRLYIYLVIKPTKIRKILKQQGIHGPPPKILLGNVLEIKKSRDAAPANSAPPTLHDTASVFPFLEQWRKQYGQVFTFSLGNLQIVHVSDPNLVKEITTTTSPDLGRPSYQQKTMGPLLGQGILTSNGAIWARQRKIIAPELFMDKGMMSIITESAHTVVNTWKQEIEANDGGGALDVAVDGYMKRFSGEIISRACFGSNYTKGQDIFTNLLALQELVSKKTLFVGLPGLRHVPTRSNRRIWGLEREIRASILKLVKERQKAGVGEDLLQTLVEGAKETYSTSAAMDQFIVDNCKNIYLAGFETSAIAASWCLMLLATNPEWQTRIRDEVDQVCEGRVPDIDTLRKMKQLHMVIQETMRLYGSAPTLSREVQKDAEIGGLRVPKGVNVWTVVATLNTDPNIWGSDALQFKPERFQDGISGACKSPNCYMPFGFGQRVCVGQHLAMVELKMLMALIMSNFSFTLSPKYVHKPEMTTILEPKHGVNILINKI
ncbi:cytochrome P450 714C2-like isoform X2 [Salvia miltiorrhiza]|uniref:cytochrome P450 714C2-like isoform X2 n=2 Tax=Salvia miltiorrhiza TaxID=226208 RepID=UPI0025AC8DC8|nr:cytochrome P450 714C2-like isoform X2 [Salvia miltiorrhiza]